jgi:hypothetical protein
MTILQKTNNGICVYALKKRLSFCSVKQHLFAALCISWLSLLIRLLQYQTIQIDYFKARSNIEVRKVQSESSIEPLFESTSEEAEIFQPKSNLQPQGCIGDDSQCTGRG